MAVTSEASSGAPQRNAALVAYRPLVEKVVAALGALVTHQIAYLLASLLVGITGTEAVAATDHGHLSLQWALITPIAVGAASGFILWQLKNLGFRTRISARSLSGLMIGFYLVQEIGEGLIDGRSIGTTLAHPAIALGVVVAPVVAWAMSRLLAGVTELAARFVADQPVINVPPAGPRPVPALVRYRSARLGSRSRPRAPPSRF